MGVADQMVPVTNRNLLLYAHAQRMQTRTHIRTRSPTHTHTHKAHTDTNNARLPARAHSRTHERNACVRDRSFFEDAQESALEAVRPDELREQTTPHIRAL